LFLCVRNIFHHYITVYWSSKHNSLVISLFPWPFSHQYFAGSSLLDPFVFQLSPDRSPINILLDALFRLTLLFFNFPLNGLSSIFWWTLFAWPFCQNFPLPVCHEYLDAGFLFIPLYFFKFSLISFSSMPCCILTPKICFKIIRYLSYYYWFYILIAFYLNYT